MSGHKHGHGYDDKHHYRCSQYNYDNSYNNRWRRRICNLRSAVSDVVFWWKLYWNGSICADDCPNIFTYCLLRFYVCQSLGYNRKTVYTALCDAFTPSCLP